MAKREAHHPIGVIEDADFISLGALAAGVVRRAALKRAGRVRVAPGGRRATRVAEAGGETGTHLGKLE